MKLKKEKISWFIDKKRSEKGKERKEEGQRWNQWWSATSCLGSEALAMEAKSWEVFFFGWNNVQRGLGYLGQKI